MGMWMVRLVALMMVSSLALGCVGPFKRTREGVATTGTGTTKTGTGGTTVIFATTSLECGGKTYEVSTGTTNGSCSVLLVNGKASSVNCTDGGNGSSASCSQGCGAAGGAGSCTVKQ